MGGQLASAERCLDQVPVAKTVLQAMVGDGKVNGGLSGLMQEECLLALLELLDANSLAVLRRSAKLRSEVVAEEVRAAELRAKVLELLEGTKFPFTHAAYVLGMNGPYYSLDTLADKHYGIPVLLPTLLCRLFRQSFSGVDFTSIRIQKFSAAANFGGQHRTLAFNLSSPVAEEQQQEENQSSSSQKNGILHISSDPHLPGHVLCLPSRGCRGGHGEVSEGDGSDSSAANWRVLVAPEQRARWAPFPGGAWLRWHWPTAGDLFAVTVSCEPASSCHCLRRRERRQMTALGFSLPSRASDVEDSASSGEDCGKCAKEEAQNDSSRAEPDGSPRRRPPAAHVEAARRVLGFTEEESHPSPQQVEEAFRRLVRAAHPDRAASAQTDPPWRSWRVSQMTWARRILQQAAAADAVMGDSQAPGPPPADHELLMLVPPGAAMPALMPPPQADVADEGAADVAEDAGAQVRRLQVRRLQEDAEEA